MSRIHWSVIREGLLLTAAAVTIGTAGSAGLTRWLRSLLFVVSPTDLWTFVAVTAFLFLVAFGISLGRARRALRVEPMTVLNSE